HGRPVDGRDGLPPSRPRRLRHPRRPLPLSVLGVPLALAVLVRHRLRHRRRAGGLRRVPRVLGPVDCHLGGDPALRRADHRDQPRQRRLLRRGRVPPVLDQGDRRLRVHPGGRGAGVLRAAGRARARSRGAPGRRRRRPQPLRRGGDRAAGGAVLLFFGLPVAPAPGLAELTADGGFAPNGWAAVWIALSVVMFSFGGIELLSITAAEAKDPARSIRTAARTTVVRLAFFYVFCIGFVLCLVPWRIAAGTGEDVATSPFVMVF